MDDQGYPQSRQRRLALPARLGMFLRLAHDAYAPILPFYGTCCCAPLRAPSICGVAQGFFALAYLRFSGCWLSVTTRQYRTACFLCPGINTKSRSLSTCFLRFYSCVLTAQPCLIPQPDKKQFCLGRPAHRWGMQNVPASTDQVMRQSPTSS